ncbi:MAG: hypothetical protein KDI82_02710 [Gammaproteobacteria bacterium]|nr:hypothetical protein [Gammaproteobacteria bacterium]
MRSTKASTSRRVATVQRAKITYPTIISTLGIGVAVIVLLAHVALLLTGLDRDSLGGFPGAIVDIGCRIQHLALPLLLAAVALQIAALLIRVRKLSNEDPGVSIGTWLKRAFTDQHLPAGISRNLLLTGNLLLVVFFVSQLSWLLNHCE